MRTVRPSIARTGTVFLFLSILTAPAGLSGQVAEVPAAQRAALERVSAESLQAHLSYLASDELGGRSTPSPGLNAAAEYIAARFRSAGLEPVGDDGFFQSSRWVMAPGRRGRPALRRIEEVETPLSDPITLRNVVGLLRGSDPVLRDTYILVTAHYDHVGVRAGTQPDSIFNGANDNGSGTAAVIELASVLSSSESRPRRSILFMALFGEERGLLGTRYYVDHPIFPLEKTVAMVNLEQVGRTDGDGSDQTNRMSITGFEFSTLPEAFVAAGRELGIEVYRHEQNSRRYFMASDNIALAMMGIPAHSLTVAFQYEDYHRPGDHWEKIDFPNMVRTVRLIGLGTLILANSDSVPTWNADVEGTERFVTAWKLLHGGG